MRANQLLEQIITQFKEVKIAQVKGYNKFGYIRETPKAVYVTREEGKDTPVSHSKILMGIEAYLSNPELYNEGPLDLRAFGVKYVTSPVWSLLHLLDKKDYIH
jgi:hypothetical protein